VFRSTGSPVVYLSELITETNLDKHLVLVRHYVIDDWPDKKAVPAALQPNYAVRDELSTFADGCVSCGTRSVVLVLEFTHEGHPYDLRMKQRCRENIWWLGIDKDIEHQVRECTACVISGESIRRFQHFPLLSGQLRKVAIDSAA